MPRPKGVTQLELLRRKQAEIAEQLQAAEAKELERLKRIDGQRRELLAMHIADHLRSQPDSSFSKSVIEFLSGQLSKPADRAHFPELPVSGSRKKTTKASGKTKAIETA